MGKGTRGIEKLYSHFALCQRAPNAGAQGTGKSSRTQLLNSNRKSFPPFVDFTSRTKECPSLIVASETGFGIDVVAATTAQRFVCHFRK